MNERPKPYVGVSGVVSELRVESTGVAWRNPQDLLIEKMADDAGLFAAGRKLALGVKATYATQWLDRPQRHGDVTYGNEWYPVGEEEFASALHPAGRNPDVMGVVQLYMGPHPPHVTNSGYRYEFMAKVMSRGSGWIQAVQFDKFPWHASDDLLQFVAETKRTYNERDLKIILQCGREAMKALKPDDVAHRLGRYAAAIDYVLFDASGGEGRRMQPDVMDDYLDAAYSSEQLSGVGFAVAGGLNTDAVSEDLPYLLQKYPGLSWDAEKNLHQLTNMQTYPLNLSETRKYIRSSVDVLR